MIKAKQYEKFLKSKVVIAEDYGFDVEERSLNPMLKPHNKDVTLWALKGGRRAIFLNWGLHKTFTQLEIATQCIRKTGKPFLIVLPLAVAGEFKRDARKFNIPYPVTYITHTDNMTFNDFVGPVKSVCLVENGDVTSMDEYKPQIYITNYERVRMGDIDASEFGGVSLDEASVLRNLQTETTDYVIKHFQVVPYRFVATATPAPNDYIEILNYAVFLNVASRGHILTRFFQRDSTKAGNLTLYKNKKKEFWQWVNTWAVFITKPSDLGYSDEGYDLPPLNIIEHELPSIREQSYINRFGELVMFKDGENSFAGKSEERRNTIKQRCEKAFEIASKCPSAIVWHDLEPERIYLEKLFRDYSARAVYGSQAASKKESLLIGFSEGEYDYLLTKKSIAGSGCNFQEHCSDLVFASIDDKFNDFIQAIHRVLRFGQTKPVNLHLVFTKEQYKTLQTLYRKWKQDTELKDEMTALIKEFGLNKNIIQQQMERQLFSGGKKLTIGPATLYNNDTVIVHADKNEIKTNSVDFHLSSWPFGDHFEYSDNYNDFGHNYGNPKFFKQCGFLTPHLHRTLKPGHIMAVHVKDRIRYSYQNGTSFTTLEDFSGACIRHCQRHGFYLMGKIVVTTDVVRENNQTYRLGWSEQCKDATKQGVGLPEYILLFRKAPTLMNNAYADEPVSKPKEDEIQCKFCSVCSPIEAWGYDKEDSGQFPYQCPNCEQFNTLMEMDFHEGYSRATWQLDAHAYWRSNGDRFLSLDELARFDLKKIIAAWEKFNKENIYSYRTHLQTCEYLDELGKLSALFMTLPVHSNTEMVWTDINRMNTLNARQVNQKKEKHICPLQLDIIRRLIKRFTRKGHVVDDCFGGLFSVPYVAMEMGRQAISVELNSDYFKDGVFYMDGLHHKMNTPTLFDLLAVS